MQWAAILLPNLALDAVRRSGADPAAPIALIDGPPQRRIVQSCTASAAQAGVRAGQPLAAARALLPNLVALDDDPKRTDALRDLLVAWAYSYSGDVAWLGSDALVLEVGGSLNLFGPWPDFERRLRTDLSDIGVTHRIALAPLPRAACVFAAFRDGFGVTCDAAMRLALRHIPLAQSRLPDEAIELLASMGLRRLGDVIDLPRAGLARRCGAGLNESLDRLLGTIPDPLPRYRPPDRFEAKFEFDAEIRSLESLQFPLRRLICDLCVFLAARDGGVDCIEIGFEHDERAPTAITLRSPAPERDANQWFGMLRLRLERLMLPAPVAAVHLLARELPPFVPIARSLFDVSATASLTWPQLVARLQARLGDGAVKTYFPAADHRPEAAFTTNESTSSQIITGLRPLWLLPRPLPLRDRGPKILAGPERIESGWWDGREASRDYYVLQTSVGQKAWAFRPAGAQDGPWLLHGWFA
ncbi:MAG: DNA polymerase Y family protein [Xanthomonadaceae bacterium]|nr:DNA polymerase Y family protein [Xanthomonadaceae bacterium]